MKRGVVHVKSVQLFFHGYKKQMLYCSFMEIFVVVWYNRYGEYYIIKKKEFLRKWINRHFYQNMI